MDCEQELQELKNRLEYDFSDAEEQLHDMLPSFVAYSKKFVELQYAMADLQTKIESVKEKLGEEEDEE